jgi:hypothetical protein
MIKYGLGLPVVFFITINFFSLIHPMEQPPLLDTYDFWKVDHSWLPSVRPVKRFKTEDDPSVVYNHASASCHPYQYRNVSTLLYSIKKNPKISDALKVQLKENFNEYFHEINRELRKNPSLSYQYGYRLSVMIRVLESHAKTIQTSSPLVEKISSITSIEQGKQRPIEDTEALSLLLNIGITRN